MNQQPTATTAESTPTPAPTPAPKTRKSRRLWRWLKYLLILLIVLLLIVFVLGYYLLNTTAGLKQAVSLANDYSGYQVSAETIEGRLLQKTALKKLSVRGKHLDFHSDEVVLDWQFASLFSRKVEVNAVTLKDSTLRLAPAESEEKTDDAQPMQLADIDLPIDIRLQDLLIDNLTVEMTTANKQATSDKATASDKASSTANPSVFVLERLQLGIDYSGQKGTIHTLTAKGEGVTADLTGHIETRGDFPLALNGEVHYALPDNSSLGDSGGEEAEKGREEHLTLSLDGDLKRDLALQVNGQGIGDFQLDAIVQSVLSTPIFKADLALKRLDAAALGMAETTARATLSVSGEYNQVLRTSVNGDVSYQSPQTDAIHATVAVDLDDKQLNISRLVVDLLTAKQQLSGQGRYHLGDNSLDIRLASDALQWPQNAAQPSWIAKQLQATLTGSLDNYQLQLSTDAETTVAGLVPLTVSANGSTQAVQDFNAKVKINGQSLALSGKAAWADAVAYEMRVKADAIAPFKQFPGIKQLDIQLSGDNQTYNATGAVALYADTIPPAEIQLDVSGTPQHLDHADLRIDSLGGQATVHADGDLSPLNLSAQILSKDIQPQRFYPGTQANINSDVRLSVQDDSGNVTVTAVIQSLDGQLQGQPLSGKGTVVFKQADGLLNINDLALNLAGNTVVADGHLALDAAQGQSDLTAKIHAKQLKRLLPDLSGALTADIVAKGNLSQPEVKATIGGRGLAYQQHRIKQLKTTANISLAADKVMLDTTISGIQSGETAIDAATVKVDGKISAHRLTVNLKPAKASPLPTLTLKANGGFDSQQLNWAGTLSQLQITQAQAGTWQLPKPASLRLGAEAVRVGQLCLQQKTASLCADGNLQSKSQGKNGQFDVKIKGLKTKTFAKFLPSTLSLDTTIEGQAAIRLQNGKPDVKGKLAAKGGQLALVAGSGGLKSEIQRFDTAFTLKNNRLENVVVTKLSKLGTLQVEAVLPDIGKPNLRAKVKINNDSLAFVSELVPQINNVRGKLNGDMTLSGNPSKQLQVAGKIQLQQTDFDVPQFGTRIRQMTLDIYAKNGNQIGFKGGAKAGGGSFSIDGSLNPATKRGEVKLKGKDFQIADAKQLSATISPDLHLIFADKIQIRGDILIPKAMIQPSGQGGSKITASEDVVLPGKKAEKVPASSPLDVEVGVKLGDDVRVASADIETRLLGGIKVFAKPGKAPTATGAISVETGELRIYGQVLTIERGRVIFSGGPIANPALDIRASRDVSDYEVTVGANVLGHASRPEISLFSTPSMPDSSILSYLLFGKPPNSDSFSSTALLQTGGIVGANTLARDIRSSVGLDVLDVSLSGIEAGKNLNKKIYVGVRSNFFDAINQFLLQYKISGRTNLDATVGTDGVATDLVKTIETD